MLGEEHRKVWGFVQEALKSLIGEGAYKAGSEARLKGFEGSYGTVLLFEDKAVVKGLQDGMPTYADKFPQVSGRIGNQRSARGIHSLCLPAQWADHAHGILANNIWTAFTLEGLGANLQHYNPLPDKSITDNFSLPESWELKAQLVFGQPAAAPGEKTFKPLEERVKIFGDK